MTKPWVVQVQKGGVWETEREFASSAAVILYVAASDTPELLNVVYTPTMQDGNGKSFLKYARDRYAL